MRRVTVCSVVLSVMECSAASAEPTNAFCDCDVCSEMVELVKKSPRISAQGLNLQVIDRADIEGIGDARFDFRVYEDINVTETGSARVSMRDLLGAVE
jgi:hypothetical protein